VIREKEKLRSDLDKAEKLKSLMASEVDDHHAAIERRNEYNLRKLDEEYKERIAALKNELRKEREQILQQVSKQRLELEQEIEKAKTEENYIRDRLALSLKVILLLGLWPVSLLGILPGKLGLHKRMVCTGLSPRIPGSLPC